MHNERHTPTVPQLGSETNGARPEHQPEIEQLRETVKRLERERDEFRHMLYGVLKQQFTEKDVITPDEKDCLTLDEFVHELEEIVNSGGSGATK